MTASSSPRLLERPSVMVGLGAVILMVPAILNGQPFYYTDMTAYILAANEAFKLLLGPGVGADWGGGISGGTAPGGGAGSGQGLGGLTSLAEGVVIKGRSIYFGVALWLSYQVGTFWSLVAFHALVVSYLTYTLAVRATGATPTTFFAAMAVMAFLTPAGYFVGLLMPDILAGVAILAFAALAVRWNDLSTVERGAIIALLIYALVSHSSHILIVLLLAAAWLLFALLRNWFSKRAMPQVRAPMAAVAGCLLVAVAAEAAFDAGVSIVRGAQPIRLPHLTARIVGSETGLAHLRETCKRQIFEICKRLPARPVPWTEFLFGTDPESGVFRLADPAGKRALSSEQTAVVLDYVLNQPMEAAVEFARDATVQFFNFGVDDLYYDEALAERLAARGPPAIAETMRQTLLFERRDLFTLLGIIYYLGVVSSVLVMTATLLIRRAKVGDDTVQIVLLVMAGLAINAAVCGIIASPLSRFQARVVWVVAVAALAVYAATARRCSSRVVENSGWTASMRR